MDVFKTAKHTLAGDLAAQRAKVKEIQSEYDWKDPEDVAFFRSMRRREKRLALIKKITDGSFRCPLCKDQFLKAEGWILNRSSTKAICRSCWTKEKKRVKRQYGKEIARTDEVFTESQVRYKINGAALMGSREALGLSRAQFAAKIGYSATWIQKLETGDVVTVSAECAREIVQVFEEAGNPLIDDLPI
jgi:ribosome-binding protein aMBF1 (putative translation factor)